MVGDIHSSYAKVDIRFENSRLKLLGGLSMVQQIRLTNLTNHADYYQLHLEGIPAEWVALSTAMVYLFPNWTETVELRLTLPMDAPYGYFPCLFTAVSGNSTNVYGEAQFELTIPAPPHASQLAMVDKPDAPPIELRLDKANVVLKPGEGMEQTLTLRNLTARMDTFTLRIEGLPEGWAALPLENCSLFPGWSERATVTFFVPPEATPGIYQGRIVALSSNENDEDGEYPFSIAVPGVAATPPAPVAPVPSVPQQQNYQVAPANYNNQPPPNIANSGRLPNNAPPAPVPSAPPQQGYQGQGAPPQQNYPAPQQQNYPVAPPPNSPQQRYQGQGTPPQQGYQPAPPPSAPPQQNYQVAPQQQGYPAAQQPQGYQSAPPPQQQGQVVPLQQQGSVVPPKDSWLTRALHNRKKATEELPPVVAPPAAPPQSYQGQVAPPASNPGQVVSSAQPAFYERPTGKLQPMPPSAPNNLEVAVVAPMQPPVSSSPARQSQKLPEPPSAELNPRLDDVPTYGAILKSELSGHPAPRVEKLDAAEQNPILDDMPTTGAEQNPILDDMPTTGAEQNPISAKPDLATSQPENPTLDEVYTVPPYMSSRSLSGYLPEIVENDQMPEMVDERATPATSDGEDANNDFRGGLLDTSALIDSGLIPRTPPPPPSAPEVNYLEPAQPASYAINDDSNARDDELEKSIPLNVDDLFSTGKPAQMENRRTNKLFGVAAEPPLPPLEERHTDQIYSGDLSVSELVDSPRVELALGSNEVAVRAGLGHEQQLIVRNLTGRTQLFELAIKGFPPEWTFFSTRRLLLYPNWQEQLYFRLAPPVSADPARYNAVLEATAESDQQLKTSLPISVEIQERLEGYNFEEIREPDDYSRLDLSVESVSFSTMQGNSFEQQVSLVNLLGTADSFSLEIEGLPPEWYRFSSSQLYLFDAWNERVYLRIVPPISASPGVYPFLLRAVPAKYYDYAAELEMEVAVQDAGRSMSLDDLFIKPGSGSIPNLDSYGSLSPSAPPISAPITTRSGYIPPAPVQSPAPSRNNDIPRELLAMLGPAYLQGVPAPAPNSAASSAPVNNYAPASLPAAQPNNYPNGYPPNNSYAPPTNNAQSINIPPVGLASEQPNKDKVGFLGRLFGANKSPETSPPIGMADAGTGAPAGNYANNNYNASYPPTSAPGNAPGNVAVATYSAVGAGQPYNPPPARPAPAPAAAGTYNGVALWQTPVGSAPPANNAPPPAQFNTPSNPPPFQPGGGRSLNMSPGNSVPAALAPRRPPQDPRVKVAVELETQRITLVAGESGQQNITVFNYTNQPDDFKVSVEGLPAAWFSFAKDTVNLFPNWSEKVALKVTASDKVRPDLYVGRIQAASPTQPAARTEVRFEVLVLAPLKIEARLTPHRARGFKANYEVYLRNRSQSESVINLSLTPATAWCAGVFTPPQVTIAGGQSSVVKLQLGLKPKTPSEQAQQQQPFEVELAPTFKVATREAKIPSVKVEGQYIHVSRWSLISQHPRLIATAVVLLIGYLFWSFIVSQVQNAVVYLIDREFKPNTTVAARSPLRYEQAEYSRVLQTKYNPFQNLALVKVNFNEEKGDQQQVVTLNMTLFNFFEMKMDGRMKVDEKSGNLMFVSLKEGQQNSFPWLFAPPDKIVERLNIDFKKWLSRPGSNKRLDKAQIEGNTLYLILRECQPGEEACRVTTTSTTPR